MRRMLAGVVVIIGAGLTVAITAAPAIADTGSYAIASTEVKFDSPGSDKFDVDVLNLTGDAATVAVQPTGCSGTASPGTAAAHMVTTITVKLTRCTVPDKGTYGVTLVVGGESLQVDVTPASSPGKPNWKLFYAFPIAIAVAAITLLTAAWRTRKPASKVLPGIGRWNWWTSYKLRLATGWSLKDSWASNVTVISAAVTGVFGGTDALKAILGSDTDPLFALAAVASAVALGLIGAAPLVLSVLRQRDHVTPLALLIGAALTVGGTGGELGVVTWGTWQLDLGGVQDYVFWGALIGGGALLVIYTYQTMRQNLHATPPAPVHTKADRGAPHRIPGHPAQVQALLMNWHNALADDVDPVHLAAQAYDVVLPEEYAQPPVKSAVF